MTETGPLRADPAALLAYSDALAARGLWADSAEYGERAIDAGHPDGRVRLEVAWRLMRAGKPRAAAVRLSGLPDGDHLVLPSLRLAAEGLSAPDPSTALLRDLLAAVSRQPPSGFSLRLVIIVALALGDEVTALDAAGRYLTTVNADDPEARQLLAPRQALDGDVVEAVRSAEHAAAGRPADPDAPVREITATLHERGRPEVVAQFLAEGYLATGRAVYGELLVERLPRKMRNRNRAVGLAASSTVLGAGLMVTGLPGLIATGLLAGLGGVVAMIWTIVRGTAGTTREQRNRLALANARFRSHTGATELLPISCGAAAGAYTLATMMVTGESHRLTSSAVMITTAIGLLAGVVAAVFTRLRGHQAWSRNAAADARQVGTNRCRCWEIDLIAGKRWHEYLALHLGHTTGQRSDAVLLTCPQTAKAWLYLSRHDLAVAVRFPDQPEPEPPVETAAYL